MNDAVQQVKDRLSIVDVVAPYVELHQAGKNMKGKSPFTAEKTPSFFVSPDRGMYYCFSTSQGGDIFTFVETMEGVDFKGALKILAEKAGVELVPEDPKKRTERDLGHAALEAATLEYEKNLRTEPAAIAYLKDRGVTGVTAKAWRIGYAKDAWRDQKDALEALGHTTATLRQVGLLKGEAGKDPYDVFRNRIMFPISDPSDRVIAFSGRVLSKDSDAPKYVNSPETPFFNKSEALFGYSKAKHGIRQMNFSLIVEGQFDVVLAHQAGYTNTVAVSGTAMTGHHVSLLQRLSNQVVLALDADRAGIAAVKRAADLMLVRGMDVKVAQIPDGEDPADIIGKDPKEFKALIGKSVHVIEFLLGVLRKSVSDDRTFKLRARDEVVPYLLKIESNIDRDHFETIIAAALDTTKEAVHLEVERLVANQKEESVPVPPVEEATASTSDTAPSATRGTDVAAYLLVAKEAVSSQLGAELMQAYQEVPGLLETTVSAESKSALVFTIEAELAEYNDLQLRTHLNGLLREYHAISLKESLREQKAELARAEQAGEDVTAHLSTINTLQHDLAGVGEKVYLSVNQG